MTELVSQTPQPTSEEQVREIIGQAARAAAAWRGYSPAQRAAVLEVIADQLDAHGEQLIPIAQEESHLPHARLTGELKRTSFQVRLFAEILRDGAFLDARIDPADPDWPMGAPRPDLRRMKEPIGPVLVFSASNFPFAFSVMGGDSASALAAGNPVIVKAHSGHPRLSAAVGQVVTEALRKADAPEGIFAVMYGTDSGRIAITDPRIAAGGFTGSIPGGRALFDMACAREVPIPFYAEMGSNNPVFVTRDASQARGEKIAEEFIGSFTMGAGQFCTKPGTLVVPQDSPIITHLRDSQLPAPATLLNERIQSGYLESLEKLSGHGHVQILAEGSQPLADPPSPRVLLTDGDSFLADHGALSEECFGPTALVVTYRDHAQMLAIARTFTGQLTASVQAEPQCDIAELTDIMAQMAGRVLYNQWPTGVSVTYAQQHGGPYPATTVVNSTSVGTAAIERFLRPVAYQNYPQSLLPEPLRDDNPWGVRQLINGVPSTG